MPQWQPPLQWLPCFSFRLAASRSQPRLEGALRHRRHHQTYRRPLLTAQQIRARLCNRQRLRLEEMPRHPRQYDVICMDDDEENSESLVPARPRVTLAEILIASLL